MLKIILGGFLFLIIALWLGSDTGAKDMVSDMETMAKETCECESAECAKSTLEGFKGKYSEEDYESLSDEDKTKVDGFMAAAALCKVKQKTGAKEASKTESDKKDRQH